MHAQQGGTGEGGVQTIVLTYSKVWLELEIKLMEEKVKLLLLPPLEDGQSRTWAIWVWLEPDKAMDAPILQGRARSEFRVGVGE